MLVDTIPPFPVTSHSSPGFNELLMWKPKATIDEDAVKMHICRKFPLEFMRWVTHELEKEYPTFNFTLKDLISALQRNMNAERFLSQIYDRQDDASKTTEYKPVGATDISGCRSCSPKLYLTHFEEYNYY